MNNENNNVFGVDMGGNNQVNLPNNDPSINNIQSNNMYNQNVNNGQAYNQNMQQPYLQQNSNQPGPVINPVNNSINSNNTNMNTNINYQTNNINNQTNKINETDNDKNMTKWSILSIVIAVAGIIWYWFIGLSSYLASLIAVAGFSFAQKGEKSSKALAIVGKILNGVLVGMAILMYILDKAGILE